MCGIAGIATTDGLRAGDTRLVDTMLATLRHRGPDEQRLVAAKDAVIGARRLSIIDLDTGSQPVCNEDGAIDITQNGEIYNYIELRDDLVRRGHTMRTKGDTEIIGHLYEELGDGFVEHLRGMFAIALWDRTRRRLVLARDRLGKKPIYWTARNGRIAYGSELKALMVDPTLPRVIDRTALAQYLQYQYIPAPRTIFEGVQKIEAATVLVWEQGRAVTSRYWRPAYEPKSTRTYREDLEEGLRLVRESVELRLRSDVPVGLFLSGGVDSSTVLALMAAATPGRVKTFSIGFDDIGYDERHYARAVAEQFDADHTEEVVRLDVVGLLPELATHFDEPFGDSSALPTFRVAQMAGREVRVVLTGDGGDETFGGYDRYRRQIALGRLASVPGPVRRQLVRARDAARAVRGRAPGRSDADTTLREIIDLPVDLQYVRLRSMSDARLRTRLLRDAAVANQDSFLLATLESGPHGLLDRMLAADTVSYLPEDLLVKMDRATMAHSVEARAPLLDHVLVEFAARLPADRKIRGGVTKVLLRDIARRLMPPALLDRPKYGFAAPLETWFRHELAGVYRETVLGSGAMTRDHFDQSVAATMLQEHLDGRTDQSRRLWLLLSFEVWARRWLQRSAEEAA
ncbi:MAG: asparagine synthase (glutamine-hydrolyzing) [Chloroflexota bacterium]|jgi:asparagine synthase (glutamine-hydrolysing)